MNSAVNNSVVLQGLYTAAPSRLASLRTMFIVVPAAEDGGRAVGGVVEAAALRPAKHRQASLLRPRVLNLGVDEHHIEARHDAGERESLVELELHQTTLGTPRTCCMA